jgi:hypothetical protein
MRPPGGVFWGQCCGNATEVPPGRRQTPSGGRFSSPFLNFRPPAAAFRRRQNGAAGIRPPAFRPASAASAKPSGPIRGSPSASPGPFTGGGPAPSLPDRPPSPAGARAAAGSPPAACGWFGVGAVRVSRRPRRHRRADVVAVRGIEAAPAAEAPPWPERHRGPGQPGRRSPDVTQSASLRRGLTQMWFSVPPRARAAPSLARSGRSRDDGPPGSARLSAPCAAARRDSARRGGPGPVLGAVHAGPSTCPRYSRSDCGESLAQAPASLLGPRRPVPTASRHHGPARPPRSIRWSQNVGAVASPSPLAPRHPVPPRRRPERAERFAFGFLPRPSSPGNALFRSSRVSHSRPAAWAVGSRPGALGNR